MEEISSHNILEVENVLTNNEVDLREIECKV